MKEKDIKPYKEYRKSLDILKMDISKFYFDDIAQN